MIFDCHTHMSSTCSADELVALADRAGVDRFMVSHIDGIYYDMRAGNSEVTAAVKRFPDRIVGYCAISSPRYGNLAVEELARCVDEGLRGLKLVHRVAGLGSYEVTTRLDDPWTFPLIAKAAELRLPILAHASAQELENLALAVPEATLILAHSGGCPTAQGDWHRAIAAARRCPNILLDTASSVIDYGYVEAMVEAVGPERVLLGTDMPFLDPFAQRSKVDDAELDGRALELVRGANLERILEAAK